MMFLASLMVYMLFSIACIMIATRAINKCIHKLQPGEYEQIGNTFECRKRRTWVS